MEIQLLLINSVEELRIFIGFHTTIYLPSSRNKLVAREAIKIFNPRTPLTMLLFLLNNLHIQGNNFTNNCFIYMETRNR